jgi:hypothetical protein
MAGFAFLPVAVRSVRARGVARDFLEPFEFFLAMAGKIAQSIGFAECRCGCADGIL